MSRDSEALMVRQHPLHGRRIIHGGLPVGQGVGIEAWEEIFASDVPAGYYIREASDAAFLPGNEHRHRQRGGRFVKKVLS
ncbi:hypothetical protein V8C35DRAFT_310675 [Trichoderma chlorosporum]